MRQLLPILSANRSILVTNMVHHKAGKSSVGLSDSKSKSSKTNDHSKKYLNGIKKEKSKEKTHKMPTKPSISDFAAIEKKIFEGTGFSPVKTRAARSAKKSASNVSLKFSENLCTNSSTHNKDNSTEKPSTKKQDVKLKAEKSNKQNCIVKQKINSSFNKKNTSTTISQVGRVNEKSSSSGSSGVVQPLPKHEVANFMAKIKANPPVTKNGLLKTHDLNPAEIIELVKTMHPRAAELLPKLTVENLQSLAKGSSSTNNKDDKPNKSDDDKSSKSNNTLHKRNHSHESIKSKPSTSKRSESRKESKSRTAVKSDMAKGKVDSRKLSPKKSRTRHDKNQSSDSEMSDWEDVGEQHDDLEALLEKDEVAALNLLAMRDKTKKKEDKDADHHDTAAVQIELDAPTLWGSKRNKKRKSEEYWVRHFFMCRLSRIHFICVCINH